MPPRRGAKQRQQPPAAPLEGCVVAFSGRFVKHDHSHGSLEKMVRSLGGAVAKTAAACVTHLVCTESDYVDATVKVKAAQEQHVPVTSIEWLLACERQGALVDVDDFLWSTALDGAAVDEDGDGAAGGHAKKRPVAAVDDDSNADGDSPVAQAKKAKPNAPPGDEPEVEKNKVVAESQFVKKRGLAIPLDSHCTLIAYQVHVDPDTGMIYDASLNLSSTSKNNNKFYRLQVRLDPSPPSSRARRSPDLPQGPARQCQRVLQDVDPLGSSGREWPKRSLGRWHRRRRHQELREKVSRQDRPALGSARRRPQARQVCLCGAQL